MPPYNTLLTITVQSTILNAISNILAQIIDQYRKDKPFTLNTLALLQFITYGILIVPINHYWQRWLEITFPGFLFETTAKATPAPRLSPSHFPSLSAGTSEIIEVKEKLVPSAPKWKPASSLSSRRRRIFNFGMKFLLDGTVGGIFNIILFVALINLLKGESLERVWVLVLQDFKPIMIARLKYRPVVSTLMYTVVPLDKRVVFGSAAGVIWGVYLSLFAVV
ncbi:hypothetical protein BDW74DRAFT_28008 [Aspergillus multicolor]|uniref:uncharacterized protein n=1 Tax=Aspergillus multicolor TaxID=41759 RepID=UPI003CCDA4EA